MRKVRHSPIRDTFDSNGVSVNGSFDLTFGLYNGATNGVLVATVQTNIGVAVTGGTFTTSVDFSNVFDGNRYWLEMGLRTNGTADGFVILAPRQEMTAAPYALFSRSVAGSGIVGTLSDAQLSANIPRLNTNVMFTGAVQFSNPSNAFTGQFNGDGGAISNLNAANLQGTLTTTNPSVQGTITYGTDIASIEEYITNTDTSSTAPIAGLVRTMYVCALR